MPHHSVLDQQDPVIHGGDIYRNRVRLDFSVSLNPMPVPEAVLEALHAACGRIRQYPDPLSEDLRRAIAAMEGVSPEQVLPGNGASELILAAVHACRPRRALLPAPCYAGYAAALRAAGAQITEYPLPEARAFCPGEDLLDLLTGDPDMVFLTDPNNPNGARFPADLLRRVLERCRENGTVVLLDECFLPLTEAGAPRGPVRDEALHLRAFTKTVSIPGVRLGYLLARDPAILAQIRRQLPEWNLSVFAQEAGVAASEVLRRTDYREASVRRIREERAYLQEKLAALGIRTYPSDANYLLLRTALPLYDGLLEEGILIRRCADYRGLTREHYRIAVRSHPENTELIQAVEKLIRSKEEKP